MKLRVKFRKYGAVRYIGHLDVMRFFQKCIRRAGIDISYSGGFSPHQIMSFAQPLSVGLTSDGEYMDIDVQSITSCQDVMERMNAASVPGIEVVSVKILPENSVNAMSSVAAAAYHVSFKEGKEPVNDVDALIPAFLAKKEILYTKETKKGVREVDIRPGIYDFHRDGDAWYLFVDASSGGNIKPVQVMDALLSMAGEQLKENALAVNRIDTFTNIGTEEEPKLVPLDDIGYVE